MTIEIRHDVLRLADLHRPDAANAIDAQMFVDLEQAWAELDADDNVSVIVNTGNGHAFQPGLMSSNWLETGRHSRPVLARRSVPSCVLPPGIGGQNR